MSFQNTNCKKIKRARTKKTAQPRIASKSLTENIDKNQVATVTLSR